MVDVGSARNKMAAIVHECRASWGRCFGRASGKMLNIGNQRVTRRIV
jgi:hypothetical protein